MSELRSLGAIYWGQMWLDALRTNAGLDLEVLAQGESYARHDWGLEVFIDKGVVEATAGSGRRLEYDLQIRLPVLPDDLWDRLTEQIAGSSARTAALLDGVLDPAILDDARRIGADLMPTRGELEWSCACRQLLPGEGLCKHVGAALYLLADSFDEDPFDLLLLRGRSRDELRSVVGELRSGSATEADLDDLADRAWVRPRGPLPAVPDPLDSPGALTPWATDPPPNAPFTAAGLRVIGSETAERAWQLLKDGAPTHLDLDTASDLARRASLAEGTAAWKPLVVNSGLTSQELAARAQAWRVAGPAGVGVQLAHQRLLKVSPKTQVRQAEDGRWFRFEKPSGRWTLVAGPAGDPEQLLTTDEI